MILVTGANALNGGEVVRRLSERGIGVRALVRHAADRTVVGYDRIERSCEGDALPTEMPGVDAAPPQVPDGAGAEAFVVAAYEAHHAEVYAFLVRTTRDRLVAEDLLQETYLRLAKEARYGRAPLEVRTWLYRVASNLVVEHPRRRARALRWLGRRGGKDEGTIAPVPDAGVMDGERTTEMERVLEGLSPDARVALLLSGEGFAGEEIATAIDRSGAATRTLLGLARARVRVRRELFAEKAR